MHFFNCVDHPNGSPLYTMGERFCVICALICLLPLMQIRALYFFNDPYRHRLHRYVHMRSRYFVLGRKFRFGMNLKVPISISSSISGICASTNLSTSTCILICACVSEYIWILHLHCVTCWVEVL
jgi:hypothetical protein